MSWTITSKIITGSVGLLTILSVIGAIAMKLLKGTFKTDYKCEQERNQCIRLHISPLYAKVNQVWEKLEQMDDSREEAGNILADKLELIAKHIGAVEQYMKDRP